MERFYRMVARREGEPFDPAEAARREVDWWRAHRELQHDRRAGDDSILVQALQRLYSYVYSVAPESVETAARERAHAMLHSDRWIDEGCDLSSPLIDEERAALAPPVPPRSHTDQHQQPGTALLSMPIRRPYCSMENGPTRLRAGCSHGRSRRGCSSRSPTRRHIDSSPRGASSGAAIARNSRDWRLWLVSARLSAKAGDVQAARRSLCRAAELNPRSPLFSGGESRQPSSCS